ncbi:uncharacterized protein MELLADRAFT_104745 [Melampsora larici-populina 98AG31]|uniref:Secreted protein n=1 Tax=Melampsora larici-populina (strain 98AG31 / pathotype 3-4-7) TaxID=747676 RepID=F4RFS3_MELLP|nr:uncharacterized protein MELLADRAFT_104745 [Melampsora larici-populina 98AG31]EGG08881.1 secreted protein [Melampsora larici-populina 98AG31]
MANSFFWIALLLASFSSSPVLMDPVGDYIPVPKEVHQITDFLTSAVLDPNFSGYSGAEATLMEIIPEDAKIRVDGVDMNREDFIERAMDDDYRAINKMIKDSETQHHDTILIMQKEQGDPVKTEFNVLFKRQGTRGNGEGTQPVYKLTKVSLRML